MKASVPDIVSGLRILGFVAILATSLCLFGTFVENWSFALDGIDSQIYRAFCLGAFFIGLIGIVMLFGFAKVIELLTEIRDQAMASSRRSD
jgi:hypothetical protein